MTATPLPANPADAENERQLQLFEKWLSQSRVSHGLDIPLGNIRCLNHVVGNLDQWYRRDDLASVRSALIHGRTMQRTLDDYIRFRRGAVDGEPEPIDTPYPRLPDVDREAKQHALAELRLHFWRFDPELRLIDNGQPQLLPSGQVDLMARDRDGTVVLMQVAYLATQADVEQLLAHIAAQKHLQLDDKVRGILFAENFDVSLNPDGPITPAFFRLGYIFSKTPTG